jgi:DNA-binding NtrC family response regulator
MPDYLIGGSPAIKRIKASLTKLSADVTPLVIIGEPGVGKSLLSSRIHAHSLLKDRQIETVNFKTSSERIQRIKLFGGSVMEFTTTRRSILELPTTVVLKHIDCTTKFLQERLATAILKRAVVRLGTKESRSIRCRLIFVFNNHPQDLSKTGSIIPDLSKIFSRNQVINVPTLKERKEDIPELAQHFFTQFQIRRHKNIDRKIVNLLIRQRWENNILDLKSFIKTLHVPPVDDLIQQNDRIELSKMNLLIDEGREFSLKDALTRIEQIIVKQAMIKHEKCQVKVAQSLGMTDRAIRRLLVRHQ